MYKYMYLQSLRCHYRNTGILASQRLPIPTFLHCWPSPRCTNFVQIPDFLPYLRGRRIEAEMHFVKFWRKKTGVPPYFLSQGNLGKSKHDINRPSKPQILMFFFFKTGIFAQNPIISSDFELDVG